MSAVPLIETDKENAKAAIGKFYQKLPIYSNPVEFGPSGEVFTDEEIGSAISKNITVGENRVMLQIAASLDDITPSVILRYKKPEDQDGILDTMELIQTTKEGKTKTELRLIPGKGVGGIYKLILEEGRDTPIVNRFIQDHSSEHIEEILNRTEEVSQQKRANSGTSLIGETTMNRVFGDSIADIAGALGRLKLKEKDAFSIAGILIDLMNKNPLFNAKDFLKRFAA